MFDSINTNFDHNHIRSTTCNKQDKGQDDDNENDNDVTFLFDSFGKTPQDAKFLAIQSDYIELGAGSASYAPYLDDQQSLINVDHQIESAKRNDDIVTLRRILDQYKTLYKSVQVRKEKIDRCTAALNDIKVAKGKLKLIPAADLTSEDLDQWQSWNDIENTCHALLKDHFANLANKSKKMKKVSTVSAEKVQCSGMNSGSSRKRARAAQDERIIEHDQERNNGNDDDDDDEVQMPETGKKNPNDGMSFTEQDWERMLSSPWTHKGISGINKHNQGLAFFPPNTIYCNVCDKSGIQWRRISQHICGKKHRARLDAWRREQILQKKETAASCTNMIQDVDVDLKNAYRTGTANHRDKDADATIATSSDRSDNDDEKRCCMEVMRLHKFFVEWLMGTIPKSDVNFKRISNALSSEFHILSPRGDTKGRTDCLEGVIHAYGTHEKNGLAIEIKDCILRSRGKTCVMTYEEWHRTLTVTTARLCTVVFRKIKGGYNGLEWVHVHETWLPGKAPWK